MITGLTAADGPAAFRADAVFDTARSLGIEYVVVCLGWWNDGLGHYASRKSIFPKAWPRSSRWRTAPHALGLKLGIHVMSASIDKSDAYVTPTPDRRLQKEGETTLAAGVDAAAATIPAAAMPASFGTARGYWAFGGTDVQIDDEIVSYRGLRKEAPSALLGCVRRGVRHSRRRRTRPGLKRSTSPSATAGTWPIRSWPARSAAIWPT